MVDQPLHKYKTSIAKSTQHTRTGSPMKVSLQASRAYKTGVECGLDMLHRCNQKGVVKY